jgi:hypothetical protein
MDQAALLTILGNLYDKLVADVAARVQQQQLSDELIDARIKNWVTLKFDDCANAWAEDAFDSLADNWAQNNLDLEDAARDAVNDMDIRDMVREAVKDLTFSVSVD